MPTHSYQAGITCILKSSHNCQKNGLFTHISTLQTGSNKTLPKVVIQSIDIMTVNIAVATNVLQMCSHAHWFTTRRQSCKVFSYSEIR